MRETELKLRIPPERLDAVRRAVTTSTATTQRLRASYFDTPDRALARHRIGLRQRQEGRRWMQTVKALSDDFLTRLEHEVRIAAPGTPGAEAGPRIDLHAPHEAITRRLDAALSGTVAPLGVRYTTDIRRTQRIWRCAGTEVEIALDIGWIRAGDAQWPVAEVEFELRRGDPGVLIELAAVWARRHGLWLDLRSKAQVGDWLADHQTDWPATRFVAPRGLDLASPPAAFLAAWQAALAPVLQNFAVLGDLGLGAETDPGLTASHLACQHQVRVGLRRLRVLAGVHRKWLPPDLAEPLAQVNLQTTALFRSLGLPHDDMALVDLLRPVLAVAGLAWPANTLASSTASDLGHWVRSADVQGWVFSALGLAARVAKAVALVAPSTADHVSSPGDPVGEPTTAAGPSDRAADVKLPQTTPGTRHIARQALERCWREVRKLAKRWDELTDDEVHRLRKAVKRLRYAMALSRPLWAPGKPGSSAKPARAPKAHKAPKAAKLGKSERVGSVGRLEQRLAAIQDVLGAYTDLLMARDRLAAVGQGAAPDGVRFYASGWVAGRLDGSREACRVPLAQLLSARRPWAK